MMAFLLDNTRTIQFLASLKKYKKGDIDLHATSKKFTTRENNPNGKRPLHWASQNGHHEAAALLLKAGANALLMDEMGYQPIHCAAMKGQLAVIRTLLCEKPELINSPDMYGQTSLILAVLNNHLPTVKYLLSKQEIHLDARVYGFTNLDAEKNGKTALHFAVQDEHTEMVADLLKAGANAELTPDNDHTQLIHAAVKQGNIEIVNLLLHYRPALINVKDTDGFTPLHLSVFKKNFDLVIFLLNVKGIDINATVTHGAHDGKTAIHLAAELVSNEIVDIILQSGATLDINRPIDKCTLNSIVGNEIKHRENLLKFSMFYRPVHSNMTASTNNAKQNNEREADKNRLKLRNSC